jgi:hypothetical protein
MNLSTYAYVAAAASLAAMLCPRDSKAGYILSSSQGQVSINGSSAQGALGTVYATDVPANNGTEYIGCTVTGTSGGHVTVSCKASDSSGNTGSCTATGTAAIQFAQNLGPVQSDSILQFSWSGTTCTAVMAVTVSPYPPR